jgi:hypothetical protein
MWVFPLLVLVLEPQNEELSAGSTRSCEEGRRCIIDDEEEDENENGGATGTPNRDGTGGAGVTGGWIVAIMALA